MKINLVRISAGAEWCFRVPVNFLAYSKTRLRLKAGNRFTVPPEPKAARDFPVARPAFNLRRAEEYFAQKFKSLENTFCPGSVKAGKGIIHTSDERRVSSDEVCFPDRIIWK
jgi:hypothetical protein